MLETKKKEMFPKTVLGPVLVCTLFIVNCLTQLPNADEKSVKIETVTNTQMYANGTILRDDGILACTRTGPQCDDDCVTLMVHFL